MCQHKIFDSKKKQYRSCTFKGDPFCSRHAGKNQDVSCNICDEKDDIYPTKCCEFKICKTCLIKNGKKECCHCKKKIKMDLQTKEIIDYINLKENQIQHCNQTLFAYNQQFQYMNQYIVNLTNYINTLPLPPRS